MDKFIKEQLKKVTVPLPAWDDTTRELIISKGQAVPVVEELTVGNYYDIQLEPYIINPPPGFTLAANWNEGTNPPEELLHVQILQLMGKMVRVAASGQITGQKWTGWLPRKGFKIV